MQVRNAELETIEFALSGNILDFYKREIREREEMAYPPFSIFIKVVVRGNRIFVKNEMGKLEKVLEKYNPSIFSSSSERAGAPYAENCVIKIKREEWPDASLLSLLRSLPLHVEVKVDPDNLL